MFPLFSIFLFSGFLDKRKAILEKRGADKAQERTGWLPIPFNS